MAPTTTKRMHCNKTARQINEFPSSMSILFTYAKNGCQNNGHLDVFTDHGTFETLCSLMEHHGLVFKGFSLGHNVIEGVTTSKNGF